MQIDPKLQIWIGLLLTVLNLVANGTIVFTGLVSPQVGAEITTGCQVAVTLIEKLLTAYSSSQPGPLAPADSVMVKAAHQLTDATTVAEVVSAKSTLNAEIAKS